MGFLAFVLLLLPAALGLVNITYDVAKGSGSFNDPNNWIGGVGPSSETNVLILSTQSSAPLVVTMTSSVSVASLSLIGSAVTFNTSSSTLWVIGPLSVTEGATFCTGIAPTYGFQTLLLSNAKYFVTVSRLPPSVAQISGNASLSNSSLLMQTFLPINSTASRKRALWYGPGAVQAVLLFGTGSVGTFSSVVDVTGTFVFEAVRFAGGIGVQRFLASDAGVVGNPTSVAPIPSNGIGIISGYILAIGPPIVALIMLFMALLWFILSRFYNYNDGRRERRAERRSGEINDVPPLQPSENKPLRVDYDYATDTVPRNQPPPGPPPEKTIWHESNSQSHEPSHSGEMPMESMNFFHTVETDGPKGLTRARDSTMFFQTQDFPPPPVTTTVTKSTNNKFPTPEKTSEDEQEDTDRTPRARPPSLNLLHPLNPIVVDDSVMSPQPNSNVPPVPPPLSIAVPPPSLNTPPQSETFVPLRVSFPEETGLGLQTVLVSSKRTVEEAIQDIRTKTGVQAGNLVGLRVDPSSALFQNPSFQQEIPYPSLSLERTLESYGPTLKEALLHWYERAPVSRNTSASSKVGQTAAPPPPLLVPPPIIEVRSVVDEDEARRLSTLRDFPPPPSPPAADVEVEEPSSLSVQEPAPPVEVLVPPASLVTAIPLDQEMIAIQVGFPVETGLALQTFKVPSDYTVDEAIEYIREQTGDVLPENGVLSVDAASPLLPDSFRESPTFPVLDGTATVASYRDVLSRNAVYWKSEVADPHANECLIKVAFNPQSNIARKQFWMPYTATMQEATQRVAEFLRERGETNTEGFSLAFPPQFVGNLVAAEFVDPATTLQQLRPALKQVDELQFRKPGEPWTKKVRPVNLLQPREQEPRFATLLRTEIANSPVIASSAQNYPPPPMPANYEAKSLDFFSPRPGQLPPPPPPAVESPPFTGPPPPSLAPPPPLVTSVTVVESKKDVTYAAPPPFAGPPPPTFAATAPQSTVIVADSDTVAFNPPPPFTGPPPPSLVPPPSIVFQQDATADAASAGPPPPFAGPPPPKFAAQAFPPPPPPSLLVDASALPPPPVVTVTGPLPPPPSFAPPPPLNTRALEMPPPVISTQSTASEQLPPPPTLPPSLVVAPLVAPPSFAAAQRMQKMHVAFPADTRIPLQYINVPADGSFADAVAHIREATGNVLPEGGDLSVDPAARHLGSFKECPTFPLFAQNEKVSVRADVLNRNVVYWRYPANRAGAGHSNVIGIFGDETGSGATSENEHANEYLLKVTFNPLSAVRRKQFWMPWTSTIRDCNAKVRDFLHERSYEDTSGMSLAFPARYVPSLVAVEFVDPNTTLQQLRPALEKVDTLEFRDPSMSWPSEAETAAFSAAAASASGGSLEGSDDEKLRRRGSTALQDVFRVKKKEARKSLGEPLKSLGDQPLSMSTSSTGYVVSEDGSVVPLQVPKKRTSQKDVFSDLIVPVPETNETKNMTVVSPRAGGLLSPRSKNPKLNRLQDIVTATAPVALLEKEHERGAVAHHDGDDNLHSNNDDRVKNPTLARLNNQMTTGQPGKDIIAEQQQQQQQQQSSVFKKKNPKMDKLVGHLVEVGATSDMSLPPPPPPPVTHDVSADDLAFDLGEEVRQETSTSANTSANTSGTSTPTNRKDKDKKERSGSFLQRVKSKFGIGGETVVSAPVGAAAVQSKESSEEEETKHVRWGGVEERQIESIEASKKKLHELAEQRRKLESDVKASSNTTMVKIKFPDTWPVVAKRFVFGDEELVGDVCRSVCDSIVGAQGFDGVVADCRLVVPASLASRPPVQQAWQKCMGPKNQGLAFDSATVLGAYKPLLSVVEYVDFVPPASFSLHEPEPEAAQEQYDEQQQQEQQQQNRQQQQQPALQLHPVFQAIDPSTLPPPPPPPATGSLRGPLKFDELNFPPPPPFSGTEDTGAEEEGIAEHVPYVPLEVDENKLYCVATQDIISADPAHLTCRTGDIITVDERYPTGWWRGHVGDSNGLFDSRKVKVISFAEVMRLSEDRKFAQTEEEGGDAELLECDACGKMNAPDAKVCRTCQSPLTWGFSREPREDSEGDSQNRNDGGSAAPEEDQKEAERLAAAGRGTGVEFAAGRGRGGERQELRANPMRNWMDEAVSAGPGRGAGLDAPPPSGRGDPTERRALKANPMKGWLDEAIESEPQQGAGRGSGLEAPPAAGRGDPAERKALKANPMKGWLDEAIESEGVPSGAGRGSGLEAPPPAGRGDPSERKQLKPSLMKDWLDKAASESAGRGAGGLEAPPPQQPPGRGVAARRPTLGTPEPMFTLDSLIFVSGRGRGGLEKPPAAGRGGVRRASGSSSVEADVLRFANDEETVAPEAVIQRPARLSAGSINVELLSASASAVSPEQLAALLQQQKRKKTRQTLRTKLPLLVIFPAYLGVESKVFDVPAKLTVAGAMDFLANLHGGFFTPAGMGLCVKRSEYTFDDDFSRSDTFPFLDPLKPLQWYEEVVATAPLYWERLQPAGAGAGEVEFEESKPLVTLQEADPSDPIRSVLEIAKQKATSRAAQGDFDKPRTVQIVFPAYLGVAPVNVELRPSMSVTDAEAEAAKVLLQRDGVDAGVLRLAVPPELEHLPEANVEIVKLGMRDKPSYPLFEHGKTLSEYMPLIEVLGYLEMRIE